MGLGLIRSINGAKSKLSAVQKPSYYVQKERESEHVGHSS